MIAMHVNRQQSQSSTLGDLTQQQFLPHDIDRYAQVNSSLLSSARSHDSAGAGGVANAREDNAENGSARSHDAAHVNNNGGFHSKSVDWISFEVVINGAIVATRSVKFNRKSEFYCS